MRLEESVGQLVYLWQTLLRGNGRSSSRSRRASTSNSESEVVPMVAPRSHRSSSSSSSSALSLRADPKLAIPSPSFRMEMLPLSPPVLRAGITIPLFVSTYDNRTREMMWYAIDLDANDSKFILPLCDSLTSPVLQDSSYSVNPWFDESSYSSDEYCSSPSSPGLKDCPSPSSPGLEECPTNEDVPKHTPENCHKGTLNPVARVFQDYGGRDSWAILNEGKLLYCVSSSTKKCMNDDVSCLDLSKGQWCLCAPMTFKRALPHTWALGGKIYVMGGVEDPAEAWCEVYDPEMDNWTTIPDPSWVRHPYQTQDMFTAASVDPVGGRKFILVGFVSRGELYLLDLSQNKWASLGDDHDFSGCSGTQIPVVCSGTEIPAVGLTLYWLSRNSTLWAYDIARKTLVHTPTRLCSMLSLDVHDFDQISTLVHIGGDMFCFLQMSPMDDQGQHNAHNRLHCCKFRVIFGKPFLGISLESCESYTVQANVCNRAVVVNPELVWTSTLLPGYM